MAQLVERKPFSRNALYAAAVLVGLALAGAVALWVKLGSAVFFEVIRSGISYCFG